MNKTPLGLKVLSFLVFTAALAALAQAQATRTWVSGVGDDVNPCSRTAPCKTYAGAISKTAVNGEISTLDPGGFGAVTVTKSITIEGTQGQGYGSILATGTTGVVINLTTTAANDPVSSVRLRNLNLNGSGGCGAGCGTRSGVRGINVSNANTRAVYLTVEDSVIDGFVNEGILFNAPGGDLTVMNSIIRNNGTKGIMMDSKDANLVHASIIDSQLVRNQEGLRAETNARVTARNCNISNNSFNGVVALTVGGTAEINLESCIVSHNRQHGILSDATGGAAIVRIMYTTVTNNLGTVGGQGLRPQAGGQILTNLHNTVRGNTTDGAPTGQIPEV